MTIPSRVRFAVLFAFIFHGFYIFTERYRFSYDAFTHMLFADHYAQNWFSLWETRWYTGFDIVSYPPLAHQLIALFIPLIGFEKSYALLLWVVCTLYPLGIYSFSRIFSGRAASSYAAIASALLLPIYVTAHIFGQLPFLTATLFSLFNAGALTKFLKEGSLKHLTLTVSLTAATMAAHHATLIVQPFFILALTISQLNSENWKKILSRLVIFCVIAIPSGILVIWPFWQWGLHQQMQTPIDHLSRHNFITDPFAQVIFFWPFYFPLVVIIPFLFRKWGARFLGLQFSFIILFILGLGSTTPLPSILFGRSWEWLTYDRFSFWASLTLLPFFGILFIRFHKWIKHRITLDRVPASLRGIFIPTLTFSVFVCSITGLWLIPVIFPIQPPSIDMKPIVNFLEQSDNSKGRYLTFGFGNQYTYLNLLTTATTIDGSYHTARMLPELRTSGIAEIDTAYWTVKGIPAIGPILRASGEYGVRWGFVNRKEYIPELRKSGWFFVKILSNGIEVWENPKFEFKPPVIPPANPIKSFSWGIFPMLSLIVALATGIANTWPQQGEFFIKKLYAILLGILPLSIGFWYYTTIFELNHAKINMFYTDTLFFLSDALAILLVILWLSVKIQKKIILKVSPQLKWLFALCCWITLSTVWSFEWRISLYLSIHWWLIFLLILSLQDWHETFNGMMTGFCAGVLIQAVTGIMELKTQSMKFLKPLNLHQPGLVDLSSPGVSILKFANGKNFLRIYGTTPHPNILGGYVLVSIMAATTFFVLKNKANWLAAVFLGLSTFLLAVTFSRSAWLGVTVFLLILILKSEYFNIQKLRLVIVIIIVTFTLTMLPLKQLFVSRTTSPATDIEKNSLVGRIWFAQHALEQIKEHPILGSGVGTFVFELAQQAPEVNSVDEVHNVPLLIFSELGLVGFILLGGLVLSIARELWVTQNPRVILVGALLAGMGLIMLLDHYFWTLAPGRMMLGLFLGLWYGQRKDVRSGGRNMPVVSGAIVP